MSADPPYEQQQAEEAAREAAAIGGRAGDEEPDQAQRAVKEGGGGEAEGFEDAERALIEHASHADQQSAHAILHDQGRAEEPNEHWQAGEPDHEHSSEVDRD